MFAKAWNYLQQQFNRNNPPRQVLTVIPYVEERPPIQQPSFDKNKLENKLSFSLVQQQPSNTKVDYQIKVENDAQLKDKMRNNEEDLQYSHAIINDIRQLERQIQKMGIHQRKLQEVQSRVKIIDHQKPIKNTKLSLPNYEIQIRASYNENVLQFRQCKYKKQKKEFPKISYQLYKEAFLYWREKKHAEAEIKKMQLQSVKKLTYKSFGVLYRGQWLNDDVVSIYIQLMDKEITNNCKYKLLNSFFATTTLTKEYKMIERVMKKKNIDKSNTIILPVNDRNHWYFVKIQPNSMKVYDSLSARQVISFYLQNTIIKNIMKFGKSLYEGDLQPEICKNFPQQSNGYDCGVFMLMGIKDVVRQRQWTFQQGDIDFKRIQLACEVLTEKLMLDDQAESEQEQYK